MRTSLFALLACAALVTPLSADEERAPAPPLTGLGTWHNVPDDADWRTEEGAVDLEKLRGKVVVLKFWMSWCSGCRLVRARFNELHTERSEQVLVIGLTQLDDRQDLATIEDYTANKLEFAVGVMQTNQVIADYEVGKIPLAVVIDKRGDVAWRGNPAQDMKGFKQALELAVREDYEGEEGE